MPTSRPAIAVINLPGLASALARAGFDILAGAEAGVKDVGAAVNVARNEGRTYVIIIGIDSPSLRSWVVLQSTAGVPILVATSEVFSHGVGIPNTRTIELPATVGQIMSIFGAPPLSDVGDSKVCADGQIESDESNFADDHLSDDAFDVFAAKETTGSEGPTDDVAPERRPAAAQVFAPRAQRPLGPLAETSHQQPQPVTTTDVVSRPPSVSVADAAETILSKPRTVSAPDRRAQVIVVFAGKGGVGKSTTAVSLGERAATMSAGLRAVVVDANRGQGDLRTFLRLTDAPLPSVYDAAVSRNDDALDDVIVNPVRLAAHRPGRAPLHFGVVLAPARDQADPYIVNASIYAKVIERARARADLVIIDTQISESFDTSGVIDDVIVPLLLDGAWGLGISDASTAGAENLIAVLSSFVQRGVPSSRLMVCINRVTTSSSIDSDAMSRFVEKYGTWMGVVPNDPAIEAGLNRGEVTIGTSETYAKLLDRVLYRMTGLASFAPSPSATSVSGKPRRRGSLFTRPRGGR